MGVEIAPEVADDPELAAHLDELLHRTCSLARALVGAEQAALAVDLDGDGHAARKFFTLSERYAHGSTSGPSREASAFARFSWSRAKSCA